MTSKTFCIVPWIHTSIRANGSLKSCCKSENRTVVKDGGDSSVPTIDTAVLMNRDDIVLEMNNAYMRSMRQTILNGEIPTECTSCHAEEAGGKKSKRLEENDFWKNTIEFETISTTDSLGLRHVDVRLGNLCNLKCVMCSGAASSLHVRESKKVIEQFEPPARYVKLMRSNPKNSETFDWVESEVALRNLTNISRSLERIHLSGGEPTMSQDLRRFMRSCIDSGRSKLITLSMNTNLANFDDEFVRLVLQFKSVIVNFSVDSVDQSRARYIRYPTDFTKFKSRVDELMKLPSHVELAATFTFMNVNLLDIVPVYEFVDQLNKERPICVYPNFLYEPTYYSINNAPESLKELATKKIETYLESKPPLLSQYPHLIGSLTTAVATMKPEPSKENTADFLRMVEIYDKIRNCSFFDSFPEFNEWQAPLLK